METKRSVVPGMETTLEKLADWNGRLSGFIGGVRRMLDQRRYDGICGSWIAVEGSRSLLIRKTAAGYLLLLCDTTHCYKTILREMEAIPQAERLLLLDGDPDTFQGEVVYDPTASPLRCGSYGVFRSEEAILREELLNEMEFALRDVVGDEED